MKGLRSWKIMTIRGVEIRIHASLLFILVYVIAIASIQFPLVVREAGFGIDEVRGGPLIWSMVFALCLFASVILHELG
ncbi:MAG: hypothetical protein AABZ06_15480, partial [Bdellovibrionota bacterium]